MQWLAALLLFGRSLRGLVSVAYLTAGLLCWGCLEVGSDEVGSGVGVWTYPHMGCIRGTSLGVSVSPGVVASLHVVRLKGRVVYIWCTWILGVGLGSSGEVQKGVRMGSKWGRSGVRMGSAGSAGASIHTIYSSLNARARANIAGWTHIWGISGVSIYYLLGCLKGDI